MYAVAARNAVHAKSSPCLAPSFCIFAAYERQGQSRLDRIEEILDRLEASHVKLMTDREVAWAEHQKFVKQQDLEWARGRKPMPRSRGALRTSSAGSGRLCGRSRRNEPGRTVPGTLRGDSRGVADQQWIMRTKLRFAAARFR